jgi:hypothetical protein
VVDEGAELRHAPRRGPPDQQPHRHRRDRAEDPDRDRHGHESPERRLGSLGKHTDQVVRHARDLRAGDPQVQERGRVLRIVGPELPELVPRDDQLGDQPLGLGDLVDHQRIGSRGSDPDLVLGALHGDHLAAVQQGLRVRAELVLVIARIGLHALRRQDHVLLVPLREPALTTRDVDHERGSSLLGDQAGVVPDDDGDDHQVDRDDRPDPTIQAQRTGRQQRGRPLGPRHQAVTWSTACIPPR